MAGIVRLLHNRVREPFAGDGPTVGTAGADRRTVRPKRQRRTGAGGLFAAQATARSPWHTGGEISRSGDGFGGMWPFQVMAERPNGCPHLDERCQLSPCNPPDLALEQRSLSRPPARRGLAAEIGRAPP